MSDDEKTCPRCAESVKLAAVVCKHCGYNFETGQDSQPQPQPLAPSNSKTSLGKGCLIIIGILAGLAALGTIFGGKEGGAETADNQAAASPPTPVTAQELEAAYSSNEAAAQQSYGNRPLLVSATIKSIDLGIGDEPFLVLAGANMFTGPQAKLDDAGKARASSLTKGQRVTLLCQSVSEIVGTPMLDGCAIQ